jgi:secernin
MCDIIFVKGEKTKIVGKNSDRPYLESQEFIFLTPKDNNCERTTYIKVPKYKKKFQVILAKPFWMWGGEMGINECGLVICNVALFSKRKFKKENSGLLGMDMIRIALEASEKSEEALNKIVELVENYGQDANSSYKGKFLYDNAFLISDKTTAFYIETVDRSWAFKKIDKTETFSNTFSIENEYDKIKKTGTWEKEKINFKKSYEDFLFSLVAGGIIRKKRTAELLELKSQNKKELTAKDIAEILKDHKGFLTFSVCMHYKPFLCPSETANSFIVEFKSEPVIWITGGPHPCMSIYKPFSFENFPKYQSLFSHENWFYKLNLNQRIIKDKEKKYEFQEKIRTIQDELFELMEKEKRVNEEITYYAIRKEEEIIDSSTK